MINEFLNLRADQQYGGYYHEIGHSPGAKPDVQEISAKANVDGDERK